MSKVGDLSSVYDDQADSKGGCDYASYQSISNIRATGTKGTRNANDGALLPPRTVKRKGTSTSRCDHPSDGRSLEENETSEAGG